MQKSNKSKGKLSAESSALIEKWLENTLAFSLNKLSHTTVSALEHLQVDRAELMRIGVSRENQDRIYRSFYVYTNGIYELLNDFDQNLALRMWDVFMRLLENRDPKHCALYSVFLQQKHDELLASAISTQLSEMQKAEDLCKELSIICARSELKTIEYQTKSQRDTLFYKTMFNVLTQKNEALQQQLQGEILLRQRLETAVENAKCSVNVSSQRIMELSIIRDNNTSAINSLTAQYSDSERNRLEALQNLKMKEEILNKTLEERDYSRMKVKELQTDIRAAIGEGKEKSHDAVKLRNQLQECLAAKDRYQSLNLEMNALLVSAINLLECFHVLCVDNSKKENVLTALRKENEYSFYYSQKESMTKIVEQLEEQHLKSSDFDCKKPLLESSIDAVTLTSNVVLLKLERNIERSRKYIEELQPVAAFTPVDYNGQLRSIQETRMLIQRMNASSALIHDLYYKIESSVITGDAFWVLLTEQFVDLTASIEENKKMKAILDVLRPRSDRLTVLEEEHSILKDSCDACERQNVALSESLLFANSIIQQLRDELALCKNELESTRNTCDMLTATKNEQFKRIDELLLTIDQKDHFIVALQQDVKSVELEKKTIEQEVYAFQEVLWSFSRDIDTLMEDAVVASSANTASESPPTPLSTASMDLGGFSTRYDATAMFVAAQSTKSNIRAGTTGFAATSSSSAVFSVKESTAAPPSLAAAITIRRIAKKELAFDGEIPQVITNMLTRVVQLKSMLDTIYGQITAAAPLEQELKQARNEVQYIKTFCAKEKRRILKFYEDQVTEKGLGESFNLYESTDNDKSSMKKYSGMLESSKNGGASSKNYKFA